MDVETRCLLEVASALALKHIPAPPPADLNWRPFLSLARHHGLLPAANHFLAPYLPAELREEVDRFCFAMELHQDALLLEQERLARLEIPLLVLKGLPLARRLYGALWRLRISSDLDILVQPQWKGPLVRALCQSGYRLTSAVDLAKPISLLSKAGIGIDLHSRITGVGRLNSVTTSWIARGEIPDADLLLYLADHGTGHWWQRLLWLCDVGRLIDSKTCQASSLLTRAREMKLLRRVSLAWQLCRHCFGLAAPPGTETRLAGALAGPMLRADWSRSKWRWLVELLSVDDLECGLRLVWSRLAR